MRLELSSRFISAGAASADIGNGAGIRWSATPGSVRKIVGMNDNGKNPVR
jgi:hypothetical protein